MDPSFQGIPRRHGSEMQYCVTREEVDWIIKDWPAVATTSRKTNHEDRHNAIL
jgi:hypothetical protein